MQSVCIEMKKNDDPLKEGLLILARIIARDFMSRQAESENCKGDGKNNESIQNK